MDQPIRQAFVNALPTVQEFDSRLINYAKSIYSKSRNEVSLQASEEIARADICAHLAIEGLADKLKLPKPMTKKVPVPEKVFNRILQHFKKTCCQPSAPSTPTKSRIRNQTDATLSFEQNVKSFTPKQSPSKTPRRGRERFGTTTAVKKSPTKKQNTDPTMEDIIEKCEAMQYDSECIEAVGYGYRHYSKQIREKWLFLGGLMCVIAQRAQPQLIHANPNRQFSSIVADLLPFGNHAQVKEWTVTVEQMVGEHSWIKRITQQQKPTAGIKRSENMMDFGTDTQWVDQMLKRVRPC